MLARTFGRVCAVLEQLGYMAGDEVTADGARLAALYDADALGAAGDEGNLSVFPVMG